MKDDRLSIVIVSHNTRQLLKECLASVYASLTNEDLVAQVFVVDNASSDDSAAMVPQEFPQAQLLANQVNVGFAAANNQALRQIGFAQSQLPTPDYVLLLNPDTLLRGEALSILTHFLAENPAVGAVGARLVHPDGSFQHSAFAFPTLAQIFLDFFPLNHRLLNSRLNGRYPRHLYKSGKPFPIDHPLGAALMVRRESIEEVGLLDERFFMYCEEIDWCMRIKAAGWRIYCVPGAEIVHYVGQSTRQFRAEMVVALWRSRYRLFEKHYSPLFRWLARRLVHLGLRWRLGRQPEISEDELAAYRQIMDMSMET
jgi:N-acetylglucosaminyl-diphospho-decaprenol L-rhamnosyltransferase